MQPTNLNLYIYIYIYIYIKLIIYTYIYVCIYMREVAIPTLKTSAIMPKKNKNPVGISTAVYGENRTVEPLIKLPTRQLPNDLPCFSKKKKTKSVFRPKIY